MFAFPVPGPRRVVCLWRSLLLVGVLALPAPSFARTCSTDEDCGPGPDSCNRFYCTREGYCAVQPLADGTYCDDGDACTPGDKCFGGGCVAGPPVACDDGNVGDRRPPTIAAQRDH